MLIDKLLELLLRILAWAVQIGAVLLIAAIFTAVVVWGVEEMIRKKRGKFLPRFLIVAILVCVLLGVLAMNPMILYTDGTRGSMSPELVEAVQSGASGIYSWNIPLVPLFVRVNHVSFFRIDGNVECKIEYAVHYFCFGKLNMEYSTLDGYNSYPMFGI